MCFCLFLELPLGCVPQVVDACAGGGGKTLALADALLGRGRVYAYDVSAAKLASLKKRADKAHLTNIHRTCVPDPFETPITAAAAAAAAPATPTADAVEAPTADAAASAPVAPLPAVLKTFRSRADVVLVDVPCSGWGVLRRNPDMKWYVCGRGIVCRFVCV